METAFKLFDKDNDGIVGWADFKYITLNTLQINLPEEQLQIFFKKLEAPIDVELFRKIFSGSLYSKDSLLQLS